MSTPATSSRVRSAPLADIPANDDSAAATVLTVDSAAGNDAIAGSTDCATGTDLSGCGADPIDVWYVAPTTAGLTYRANATGAAGGNLVISVFDDGAGTNEIACADPFGDDNAAVTFLSPGGALFVRVASATDTGVDFSIEVNELVLATNDDCDGAIAIACNSLTAGSTANATFTDEEPLPDCGTAITTAGVWYSLPGTGGDIQVSTCQGSTPLAGNATYDTKLSVFASADGTCATLSCVGGNDDDAALGCGDPLFQSTFTWASDAATTYYVLVHGFTDSTGDFDLAVNCAVPTGACCAAEVCSIASADDCAFAGGTYLGDGTECGSGGFGGLPSDGFWTLTISDNAGADLGTFDGWTLDVNGTVADDPAVNLSIPDNDPAGTSSSLFLDAAGAVSTISVTVFATHTFAGDLIMTLTSPGGIDRTLVDRIGGTSELAVGTAYTFSDDGIADWVGTGDPIPAGTYAPTDSLATPAAGPCADAGCLCEFGGEPDDVDVQDLLGFLALWFESLPGADLNGGGVDVTDLLDFLECWFIASAGTCP